MLHELSPEAEAELVQKSTALQAPKSTGRAARHRTRRRTGWCQANETTTRAMATKMQRTLQMSSGEWTAARSLLSKGVAPLRTRGATHDSYNFATCDTVCRRCLDHPPPSERM